MGILKSVFFKAVIDALSNKNRRVMVITSLSPFQITKDLTDRLFDLEIEHKGYITNGIIEFKNGSSVMFKLNNNPEGLRGYILDSVYMDDIQNLDNYEEIKNNYIKPSLIIKKGEIYE